jgi:hypothetical protein
MISSGNRSIGRYVPLAVCRRRGLRGGSSFPPGRLTASRLRVPLLRLIDRRKARTSRVTSDGFSFGGPADVRRSPVYELLKSLEPNRIGGGPAEKEAGGRFSRVD